MNYKENGQIKEGNKKMTPLIRKTLIKTIKKSNYTVRIYLATYSCPYKYIKYGVRGIRDEEE